MKKETFNALAFAKGLVEDRLNELNKQKSVNTLTDEQKDIIDAALKAAEARKAKLDEEESQPSAETIKKEIMDAVEEQLKGLVETMTGGDQAQNLLNLKAQNYLASEEATHEFLQAIRNNKTTEGFVADWGECLSKNGITGDLQLPTPVRTAITDAWEKDTNWLAKLKHTRAKKLICPINTSAQDADNSRAHGWKEGAKKENELAFTTKTINAQYIYTLIMISNKTLWDDDGSMLRYITEKLFSQWRWEAARAILVGDGRVGNDHIDSVEAIYSSDRGGGDEYVTIATHDPNKEYMDEIMDMLDSIHNEDGERLFIVMKKQTLTKIRRYVMSVGGTPQYVTPSVLADMMGVDEIITTSVLGKDVDIIAFMPDHYVTTGSINPVMASWEDYKTNQKGFRIEVPFGGALDCYKSAAVLKAAEAA